MSWPNINTSQSPSTTSIQPHYDVVIVGAGMVGAALACALDDLGMQCLVLEKQVLSTTTSWPSDDVDPRVSAISLASQNVLNNVGAWSRITPMQRLQPYQDMYVWDACGTGHIAFSSREQHLPHLGHIVENRTINSVLHQALKTRQVTVLEQTQLSNMSPQSTPDVCHQARQLQVLDCNTGISHTLSTDLVIGADGGHSKVRQLAGIPTREWDYPHYGLVTRVTVADPHQATAWQRFTENGILAFLPLRSPVETQDRASHCSIVWSQPKAVTDKVMAMDEAHFCQTLTRAFEGKLGDVLACDKRYVFSLKQCHAVHYIQSGLALVGDAAHTIHPLAGQGVNLGFLDVAALVHALQQAQQQQQYIGDVAVLNTYQRLRRQDNLRMMALMESFVRGFGNQNPFLSMLRNYGLQTMQKLTPVKQHIAQQALGVGQDLPPLAR